MARCRCDGATRPRQGRQPTFMQHHRHHLRYAVALGAVHWALLVALQIENYLRSISPLTNFANAANLWSSLPWWQSENIFVATVVAMLAYIALPWTVSRRLFAACYLALNALLCLEQVQYKLVLQHFRLSMTEGWASLGSALQSSWWYELDGLVLINAGVVLVVTVWLLYQHGVADPKHTRQRFSVATSTFAAAVAVLFVGGFAERNQQPYDLASHPFIALALSAATSADLTAPTRTTRKLQITPTPPTQNETPDPQLAPVLANLAATLRRPNVVLVVLESVGARQLLNKDSLPSATITPTLAAMANNGVLFNSVYSVFPGTVRSHVALNTGGRTITWGNVFNEFSFRYNGPTLAQQFAKNGYQTALFSSQDLDYENMTGFYRQAGFDTVYDFASEQADVIAGEKLNSWGGKEEHTIAQIRHWLTTQHDRSKPFLLAYFTVATHHPYDTPDGVLKPLASDERNNRYLNALQYTDETIAQLRTLFAEQKLADNTLWVILGDHGEAFGDLHAGNLLHKQFLYEENVRTFLLLSSPSIKLAQPVVATQTGSIGDVASTVLAASGLDPHALPGRSLWNQPGEGPQAFFYKIPYPQQWGLRDGAWKFIANLNGTTDELYRLDLDPNETHNLAPDEPERVAHYTALVSDWYFQTNDSFTMRLENYRQPGERGLTAADVTAAGPKVLTFGHGDPRYSTPPYLVEAKTFHPNEAVIVWTLWTPFGDTREISYHWLAPSGRDFSKLFNLEEGWTYTYVGYDGPLPMEQGHWRVVIGDLAQPLFSGEFDVAADAPLFDDGTLPVNIHSMTTGYVDDDRHFDAETFNATTQMPAAHVPLLWLKMPALKRNKKVWLRWRSPSGSEHDTAFDLKQGWEMAWIFYDGSKPVELGAWQVSVWDETLKIQISQTQFTVM